MDLNFAREWAKLRTKKLKEKLKTVSVSAEKKIREFIFEAM